MGEGFWGGLFFALPAIIASIMAYWKSEKAEARAAIAQQLAGVCRFTPCYQNAKSPSPADDNKQEYESVRDRLSILESKAEQDEAGTRVEY